jgi:MFS family permease
MSAANGLSESIQLPRKNLAADSNPEDIENAIELQLQIAKVSEAVEIPAVNLGLEPENEDEFPEGGLQAWTAVVSAVTILYPSFGFMVSIGTLQDYWHQHQLSSYTSRDVGWIPSVFVYLALALGIWIGPLSDKYGPRYIALLGSLGYVVMMFLLAECKTFWQLLLCCGILGGVTGATLTTTSLAVVAQWFKKKRGFAQGIAMAGSSFGGFTQPLILRATLGRYGYAWAIRTLAFVFAVLLIVGNLTMKTRLKPTGSLEKRSIISFFIFKDLRFSLLTISVFGFEVVLFGTLGILPTYATINTNFGPSTGFYLISILNGTSCFGRLLPGYISDKIGRFNTLLISIVFTLFFMLVLWLPFGTKSLAALYAFSSIFGFGTGCWMAMTPATIGQLCRADEFGRYYGTLYFLASLATLICIPISGELAQVVGPQALVAFFVAVLGLSLLTFCASRWECLDRQWKWAVII